MEIPYTVDAHPETGLNNGKIGIWLFLTSEVMLFGALFATFIMLRIGAEDWAHLKAEAELNIPLATVNTIVLITSSVTMVMAWAAFKMNEPIKGRRYLLATVLLSVAFLLIKIFLEYIPKFHHDITPATSTFYGIYFCMTGLHGLHILGGIVVIGYFWLPGFGLWDRNPEQYTNRIECTGLYWHFVDLVWIFLFPVFYLL
jgi:heme/copper-type cytochrome/quinol oxidase subunit 3